MKKKKRSLREIVFRALAKPGTTADIAERVGEDEQKVRAVVVALIADKRAKRIGGKSIGVYGRAGAMDLDTLSLLAAARQRGRFGALLAQLGGAA